MEKNCLTEIFTHPNSPTAEFLPWGAGNFQKFGQRLIPSLGHAVEPVAGLCTSGVSEQLFTVVFLSCELESEATVSPVCSGAGHEREESLHIYKGDMYLPVQFMGQQKVVFRIDNSFAAKDLGHHNGALHINSAPKEKRNIPLRHEPSHLPMALITFKMMTTSYLVSPARKSHLSSRQLRPAVFWLQCLVHVYYSLPKSVT